MAEDKHFKKTNERKSVLTRNTGYRKNCSSGFVTGLWQAHHVACHHAVDGREIEDEYLEYVENCLWITEWDLNASDNLVGLPVNIQYRMSNGEVPVNYCSHQVDHNTSGGYTDECKQWLKDNLWDTLKDKKKKHEVTAKSIASTLKKCTSTFKTKLTKRGKRNGGTKTCWKNRFKDSYENKWYHPFSMAAVPNKRHPGVDTDKWKKMVDIFKKLG
jgi:hypothetical protein